MESPSRRATIPPARGLFAMLVIALVFGLTAQVYAGDEATSNQERARNLFASGAAAYAQGRYDEAISLFQTGDGLAPRAAFSFNLAVAYEGKGEPARALEHYRNYVRRGTKPEERETIALDIKRLEALLAKRGIQQVTLTSESVATFVVDGRAVGSSPWTGELSPGQHDVEVRPFGAASFRQSFTLPAAYAADVRIAAPTRPDAAVIRPLVWTFLGVTGAAATVGTVLGFLALDRKIALDDACGPNQAACPPGSEADIATFRGARTASYVSFGVALASAVTTVVLFTQLDSGSPKTEIAILPYDLETGGFHASLRTTF